MASQSQSVLQCSLTQRIVKHPVAQLVMTLPVRDVGVTMASQSQSVLQSDTMNSEAPCGPACDDLPCERCGSGDGITNGCTERHQMLCA